MIQSPLDNIEHLRRMVRQLAVGKHAAFGNVPTLCGRCRFEWLTIQEAWACYEAHPSPAVNEER